MIQIKAAKKSCHVMNTQVISNQMMISYYIILQISHYEL